MIHSIRLLFEAVADLTPDQRDAYFARHGIASPDRVEVEALLQFDSAPHTTLGHSVTALAREFLAGDAEPRPGNRCGVYELDRLLGRGGMGAVFLAHRSDGEVERKVAIKFARDLPDDPAGRHRFLRERQFLASLNHPGIARLLDAGRDAEGQPYLVMEYVEGVPLDVYAESLDLRNKLQLFLKVCASLAYAHRNLIIHRDLKPSNILVDSTGQPKLLDFGIARMLDDGAIPGVTRNRVLTPEYASPEQFRGSAHNTATDVYSLGAVFYHLLTGRSPHAPDLDAPQTVSMEERILHRDPPPPTRLNPALPRDLDFICAKALRKEPEDRYVSVSAFAEDIGAFLEFRPVRARTGDAWYRTRKLMRRLWLPLAATGAVMLVLSVGLFATARQRAIAQHRFVQLRQFADRVLHLDQDIRELPGATSSRQKIVAVSMEYLDGLGREAKDDRELALDLANGYLQLAKVQGIPSYPNLGQFAEAESSLRKAEAFAATALKGDPAGRNAGFLATEISQARMMVADSRRRNSDVLIFADQAGARLEKLDRAGRITPDEIRLYAPLWFNVGQAYMNQHRFEDAVRLVRRGVVLSQSVQANKLNTAGGMSLLANVLRQSGDLDGALSAITESRKLAETVVFPGEVQKASILYTILWRQSQILSNEASVSLDRPDDAVEPAQQAFDLMNQLAAKDLKDATSRSRLGLAAQQLGDVLRVRDPRRALAAYDRGIARQREIPGAVKARAMESRLLALSSYPLRRLHRRREAGERISAAFSLLLITKDFPSPQIRLGYETEDAFLARADLELESGQPLIALATCRELLDKAMAGKPRVDTDLILAAHLARIYATMIGLCVRAGDPVAAAALGARRIALWRAWDARLPHNPFIQHQLQAAEDSR